jgi:hypothetical protein
MRLTRLLALALVATAAAACGDPAETASPPEGAEGDPAPSRQAASICEEMVRDGIEEGVAPLVGAPRATLAGDTYSCRYRFAGGSADLAVEDLGTPEQARADIADQLGGADVREGLPGLAEGGLWKTNGNLALSKDEFVLTVDVTDLPAGEDKHAASLRIAEAVLGCW